MTKKTFSKVIATVIVAALCLTVVFTGAVSAETRTANCTVTGAKYDVGAKDSYVTAEVTFTSANAFTAGSFTAAADGLTFLDCSVAQNDGGGAPEVYLNVSNKKILFAGFTESATNDIKSYTSLTLVLKFTVSNYQSVEKAPAGTFWTVNVTGIDITNTAEETYTTANASGTIHVHNFGSASEANGITTTTCSLCNATHAEVTGTGFAGNTLADTRKASVTFTATGDTVLNALIAKSVIDNGAYDSVYFIYEYKGDAPEPIKATTVAAPADTNADYYVFPCFGDAGIGRLSRNVSGNFVTVKGSTVTISDKWEYSIKAYAEDIIGGSFTDAEKNYAKALLNYGFYTATALDMTADAATYTSVPYDIGTNAVAANSTLDKIGTDAEWGVKGISVTTGFKPKMNIRFNADTLANKDAVTIKVTVADKLVYFKEVAVSSLVVNPKSASGNDTYILSDIPTKYLTGDIVIGAKSGATESPLTCTYSYGKYAKARESKPDENVFKSLMNWSYYLVQAFGISD